MRLNRQERRRLAAISRKYRGLQASSISGEKAARSRAAEELAPAYAARSKKLRGLGILGLLLIVLAAVACASPAPRPAPEDPNRAQCMRVLRNEEFCSCYAEALPAAGGDQIEAMSRCARPGALKDFKSLRDLFQDEKPLGPPALASR